MKKENLKNKIENYWTDLCPQEKKKKKKANMYIYPILLLVNEAKLEKQRPKEKYYTIQKTKLHPHTEKSTNKKQKLH